MKKAEFLKIAVQLNNHFHIVPMLFGSLGLEQRLNMDLNAKDIDILIPESILREKWDDLVHVMNDNGYTLYDLHEHEFKKAELHMAFASIENLTPFAGIDLTEIPIVEEEGVRYFLLDLRNYLKVYSASSMDGYRKNTKNKNDHYKIKLINEALEKDRANLAGEFT